MIALLIAASRATAPQAPGAEHVATGAVERVPLHPNARGMAGIADVLVTALQKERP